MSAVGVAVIDGVEQPLEAASLPMTDQGVVRGDGGFETMGVWSGRPFRRSDHIERLQASLAAAVLPPVDETALAADIDRALARGTDGQPVDGALRVYVTASGTRVVLFSPQPVRAPLRWLQPVVAPWIRPVGTWALAGAKTMSYMPNMTASRIAQRAGADDALLVSLEGVVLEGPTFGVVWVRDGVVCATATDAGIVDSISRRTVLELATDHGIPVQTGSRRTAPSRFSLPTRSSTADEPADLPIVCLISPPEFARVGTPSKVRLPRRSRGRSPCLARGRGPLAIPGRGRFPSVGSASDTAVARYSPDGPTGGYAAPRRTGGGSGPAQPTGRSAT